MVAHRNFCGFMVIAALNQGNTNMFNQVNHKMYTTYCTQIIHTSEVSVSEPQIPLRSVLFHL